MEGADMSMNATESARLVEWLTAQGFTAAQIAECLSYIASGIKR